MSKENTYEQVNEKGDLEIKAMPIISIYFLAYKLYKSKAPVLKITHETIDNATNKPIKETTEFTKCLTHKSYIIQIPYLKAKRRNDIEKLLAIFDQTNKEKKDEHVLNLNENDFPEKYREVVRRLVKANAEPTIRRRMDNEDDYITEIRHRELAIKRRENEIEEKDKKIEEKDKKIEEKDKKIEEKEQTIINFVKMMSQKKLSIEEIQKITSFSATQIQNILNS